MATEFCIYRIPEEVDVKMLPWVDGFNDVPSIFYERRPMYPFYDIKEALLKKNKYGDDYVEILPEDYHLLERYVKLSKYQKEGHKFVCCII